MDMETQEAFDDTDRTLAAAVLEDGNDGAFRQLYRRHTDRLLGVVYRLLGQSVADAEDAVQETWLRAFQGLDRFRWDSLFSTWLIGIGIHVAHDRLRRAARSRVVEFDGSSEVPAPASRHSHEQRIDLERAVALLPDGCRMILVLHDVEGMKHREIAERMGIASGTSKSQLAHARKLLRALLSRKGDKE